LRMPAKGSAALAFTVLVILLTPVFPTYVAKRVLPGSKSGIRDNKMLQCNIIKVL